MTPRTDIPALRLQVLDVLNDALTNRVAYHIPDVQVVPTIELLNLLPRFLDELQAMRAKWEFEHELAVGQAEEIERLDEEIDSLRRDLEDDGTHADRPSYVGPPVPTQNWHTDRTSGHQAVAQPAYVVPPADPKLMNWADGKEHALGPPGDRG